MTEPQEIQPALRPEQWAKREYETTDGDTLILDGHTLEVESENVATSAQVPKLRGADRHALAALALYGQSFGFDRRDVEAMEAVYRWVISDPRNLGPVADAVERCYNLAARIAALLPPPEVSDGR